TVTPSTILLNDGLTHPLTVQGVTPGTVTRITPGGDGFNLNTYTVGLEKTLFDGRASVYVRIPVLEATQNVSGQAIDGLGDVSAGFKFALLADRETGSTFTGGLTVSAPTARDTIITSTRQNSTTSFTSADAPGTTPPAGMPEVVVQGPTTPGPTVVQTTRIN